MVKPSHPKLVDRVTRIGGSGQYCIDFGTLQKGDAFGESSAFFDEANPWTIISTTDVRVYKVSKDKFINEFGGHEGAPA